MIKRINITHLMCISVLFLIGAFYATIVYQAFESGGYKEKWMAKYTMTDGHRTVVFQNMMHIGLKSFYHSVGNEMTDYRNNGYKVFSEDVGYTKKPLNQNDRLYKKEKEDFEKNLSLYKIKTKEIEELYFKEANHVSQNIILDNYFKYDDIPVDISRSDFKKEISNMINSSGKNISDEYKEELSNTSPDYGDFLTNVNSNPKMYIFINNLKTSKTFTAFSEYISNIQKTFNLKTKARMEIIKDKRDQILADAILEEKGNIYIEFGGDHFDPVFKILNERTNNSFKIVNVQYKKVLSAE